MNPKEIIVNDRMQQGYRYLLTQPTGRCFFPEFSPDLTPKEMLALGIFGGKYMTDCRHEFPTSWFTHAKLSPQQVDPRLNYFKVNASKPLSYWIEKGWIHPQDPRGWFQWYCNYYLGRRLGEDELQIKRWRQFCIRHSAQIHNNPDQPRFRQKQGLLHWSYNWKDKFTECLEKNLNRIKSI